ncbi:hypothetical protein G6F43_010439 [Rhizopus delemar]|nr:hypothetical protein G6F43_010439 [Rhizopus delemar]
MFFPGNFASTAINMLIKNTKTTRGEDAIDHLWKEISKHLQVPNLLHHTKVAEVNQAQRQSLGKRMHEEENNYQDKSIRLEWQRFLKDPLRHNPYEPLSPKGNSVICSKELLLLGVSQELQGAFDLVLDAATLEEYEEGIEELRSKEASSTKEMKLEIDFSVGYVVEAFPGEGELQSMMKQQQQQGFKDSQYIYKADGVVRSKSSDEVLVLETSSADNSTSNKKVSFDHYEAMFSLLAMMKTLAEE